jgi:hypothetical protein
MTRGGRIKSETDLGGRTMDLRPEPLLEARIKRDRPYDPRPAFVFRHEVEAEAATHEFAQIVRILRE